MRILVTNDDGINAAGLAVMERIAGELAGPEGEVWVVAPAFEQSGVAHCISYTHPTMIAELGPRRFAAEGTPADCVLAGIYHVLKEAPPDLVLSGVNRGNNAGENVLYSGTVGGAMEAALQGLRAVALSQFLGPENARAKNPYTATEAHAVALLRRLIATAPWGEGEDYRLFYNINFPPVPAADVKGVQVTTQGFRRDAGFSLVPHVSPTGRQFLWIKGGEQGGPTLEGSDVAANVGGYISVTPLRADLTAHDRIDALRAALG